MVGYHGGGKPLVDLAACDVREDEAIPRSNTLATRNDLMRCGADLGCGRGCNHQLVRGHLGSNQRRQDARASSLE